MSFGVRLSVLHWLWNAGQYKSWDITSGAVWLQLFNVCNWTAVGNVSPDGLQVPVMHFHVRGRHVKTCTVLLRAQALFTSKARMCFVFDGVV